MSKALARRLTILNQSGIHALPAARLVIAIKAAGPNCAVTFRKGHSETQGNSIIELLVMELYQGAEMIVEVRGPQAREVIEAITALVNSGFNTSEPRLEIPAAHSQFIRLDE